MKRQTLKRQTLKQQTLKRQTLKQQTLKRQTLKQQTLKRQTLKRQTLKRHGICSVFRFSFYSVQTTSDNCRIELFLFTRANYTADLLPYCSGNVSETIFKLPFYPVWLCGPARTMASSFMRFLDHTATHHCR